MTGRRVQSGDKFASEIQSARKPAIAFICDVTIAYSEVVNAGLEHSRKIDN